MGLTIAAEVVAANGTRATYTGGDNLLAKFGLHRLYNAATSTPPANPYQKLKQAGDRRLFKDERWSVASVVDWPDNRQFSWRDFSQAELRRGFPLSPTPCDLQDEERGSLVAGVTVGPSTVTPTASEGPSDVTGRIKIKIKTGAKRVRAASTEPGAAAGASDVSPGQPAAGPAKASGALQGAGEATRPIMAQKQSEIRRPEAQSSNH